MLARCSSLTAAVSAVSELDAVHIQWKSEVDRPPRVELIVGGAAGARNGVMMNVDVAVICQASRGTAMRTPDAALPCRSVQCYVHALSCF